MSSSVGVSAGTGGTTEGVVLVPAPEWKRRDTDVTPGVTTVAGAAYSTGPSVTTPG